MIKTFNCGNYVIAYESGELSHSFNAGFNKRRIQREHDYKRSLKPQTPRSVYKTALPGMIMLIEIGRGEVVRAKVIERDTNRQMVTLRSVKDGRTIVVSENGSVSVGR